MTERRQKEKQRRSSSIRGGKIEVGATKPVRRKNKKVFRSKAVNEVEKAIEWRKD